VLNQHLVGPLQEKHEVTKIKASKVKRLKLSYENITKSKYKRRYNTKYKMKKLPNWRIIPGNLMDTRKLMNRRNRQ
jgi:hypothetical protein